VSELALTLIRLGFLALLWAFVLITVFVLRRDLKQPADARPIATRSARGTKAPRAPKPEKVKVPRASKVKGTKLVVTEGPLAGTIVPLDGAQVTIGRAPDSTIVIDDDYASSRLGRGGPRLHEWHLDRTHPDH